MTRLLAFAIPFLLMLVAGSRAEEPPKGANEIVLQDNENFSLGSYGAFASPWSTFFDKTLERGRDYLDTITVRPSTFPDDTIIDTRWPLRKPDKSGVWGYHLIAYGNYDGGAQQEPVTPRRVKDIGSLSMEFDYSYEGSPSFNLLTEFYLTSKAGDSRAKVIEIGFFLHVPPRAGGSWGTPVARYVDPTGAAWKVARLHDFITIIREDGRDFTRGTIDIVPVLALLKRKGLITGNEWFNGIAFGTEPTDGGGSTRIRIARWRVTYD